MQNWQGVAGYFRKMCAYPIVVEYSDIKTRVIVGQA